MVAEQRIQRGQTAVNVADSDGARRCQGRLLRKLYVLLTLRERNLKLRLASRSEVVVYLLFWSTGYKV